MALPALDRLSHLLKGKVCRDLTPVPLLESQGVAVVRTALQQFRELASVLSDKM